MIAEFVRSLVTPVPWPIRRLGYLKEAIGCEARYRRCRAAWQPHLEACHAVIREAAARCASHGQVVVLGSGGLHDVPLADLARTFREVVLVDVVHLPAARRLARPFRNVRFLERDVSGVIGGLTAAGPLPLPDRSGLDGLLEADLVVSPNLLSQLPVRPRTFLASKTGRPPAEIDAFCRAVAEAHLAALGSCAGTVCLISEIEHLLVDGEGRVIERDLPLDGVSMLEGGTEWAWDIAPCPEAHPEYGLRYTVRGVVTGPYCGRGAVGLP